MQYRNRNTEKIVHVFGPTTKITYLPSLFAPSMPVPAGSYVVQDGSIIAMNKDGFEEKYERVEA